MKLEELADVARGITTGKAELNPSSGEAYRVIQIRHVQGGAIVPTKQLKAVYLDAARAPTRFAVKEGDILVAMLGQNPKVVSFSTSPKRCLVDKDLARVRPKSKAAGARILKFLTSAPGQEMLASMRTGVTIAHMKLADLRQLDIP